MFALDNGPRAGPACRAGPKLTSALPDAALAAKANRAFLATAVRYVAGAGVGQFVDIGEQIQAAYGDGTVLTGRTGAEVAALSGDFDLVPPGIVPVTEWPLDAPDARRRPHLREVSSPPTKAGMLAGIGRKPG